MTGREENPMGAEELKKQIYDLLDDISDEAVLRRFYLFIVGNIGESA